MGSAILNWTWLDWSENNSSNVHLRWIHIRRDDSFIRLRNMFFHCVIQGPNGDRLISSLNPEELCSKTHVSVRCAMSFWQVRFSGWFRSIGRISLWTHNNTGWCSNVMAPRNRRPLCKSLVLFICLLWYIFGMDIYTFMWKWIVGQVGFMWRCGPKTLLWKQTRFFRLDDIFKVIFGSLTFGRSGWPLVNEPNHCSRFHFERRYV